MSASFFSHTENQGEHTCQTQYDIVHPVLEALFKNKDNLLTKTSLSCRVRKT